MSDKILGDDPPDVAAMKELQEALARVVDGSRVQRAAGIAYVMAMCAQAATQGLIDMLKAKNLVSDAEVRRFLARSYKERYKELAGSNGVILTTGPVTRRPS